MFGDLGLNSRYDRTMDFESKDEQTAWFDAQPHTSFKANYNKIQNTLMLNDCSIAQGMKFNYARVTLTQESYSAKIIYYGFVSNPTVVDDEVTAFAFDIDPIQTFMCDWTLGNCYVEQEHVDRWGTSVAPKCFFSAQMSPQYVHVENYKTVNPCFVDDDNHITMSYIVIGYSIPSGSSLDDMIAGPSGITNVDDAPAQNSVIVIPVITTEGYETRRCSLKWQNDKGQVYYTCPSLDDMINGLYNGLTPSYITFMAISPIAPVDNFFYSNGNFVADHVGVPVRVANYNGNEYYAMLFLVSEGVDELSYDKANGSEFGIKWTDFQKTASYSLSTTISAPESATDIYDGTTEPLLYLPPIRDYYIANAFGSIKVELGPIFLLRHRNAKSGTISVRFGMYASPDGVVMACYPKDGISDQTDWDYVEDVADASNQSAVTTVELSLLPIISSAWVNYAQTQQNEVHKLKLLNIGSAAVSTAVGMATGGGAAAFAGKSVGAGVTSAAGQGSAGLIGAVSDYIALGYQEDMIKKTANTTSSAGGDAQLLANKHSATMFYNTKCDAYTYERVKDSAYKFGYTVLSNEVPDIRSRYWFNYIKCAQAFIKGAIAEPYRSQIQEIFEAGIFVFHCHGTDTPVDFPTDSDGNLYENIETSLITERLWHPNRTRTV